MSGRGIRVIQEKKPLTTLNDVYSMSDTLSTPIDTPKYPYKLGHIADRGGDLSKRWYVAFWVYDVAKGKKVRKMEYGDLSNYPTYYVRMAEARKIKEQIDELLKAGYVVDSSGEAKKRIESKKELEEKKNYTIGEALNYSLDLKQEEISTDSMTAYRSNVREVEKFLKGRGYWNAHIDHFNHEIGNEICNFFKSKRGTNGEPITNNTVNNYLGFFRALISVLRREGILSFDPTEKAGRMKTKTTYHQVYSDKLVEKVRGYLQENDPQLWLLCQFVYYCFVRPGKEASNLQIKHLREDNRLIITSEVGKTSLRYPEIPVPLQKEIEKWDLRNFPADYYIFSTGGKPGAKKVYNKMWAHKYQKVRKSLHLSSEYTLYSWKHTGACKLYQAVKDPYLVMQQCGHTNIETTMKYLRQLGLFTSNEVTQKFPEM